MTAEPYEDVPGVNEASRALRLRQYAAMQLVADYGRDSKLIADVINDYTRAGFTTAEIFAATSELRGTYQLDDRAVTESIEELRRMVTPVFDYDTPQLQTDYRCSTVDDAENAGGWLNEDER